MKKNKLMITTEMFHELLDDSKTDPVIFFEQMMGHLFCTTSELQERKMKVTIDIEDCNKCPYYRWHPDDSCSNHSGESFCAKEQKCIEWDNKRPKIPKWCPLKKEIMEKMGMNG